MLRMIDNGSCRKCCVSLFLILLIAVSFSASADEHSKFTYQGVLKDAGSPANGVYDFSFTLSDATKKDSKDQNKTSESTIIIDDVNVSNGQFTVQLDFGYSVLKSGTSELQIAVRQGTSSGSYTILSPKQSLTSAPYAVYASSLLVPAEITASDSAHSLLNITNESGPAITGQNNAANGAGIVGTANNGLLSTGVYGMSVEGSGVKGMNSTSSTFGSLGSPDTAVKGISYQNGGTAVFGEAKSGFTTGVKGDATGYGIFGISDYVGVYGEHNTSKNYGWLGTDKYGFAGINNVADGSGGFGESTSWEGYGLFGQCDLGGGQKNYGYIGNKHVGVYGETSQYGAGMAGVMGVGPTTGVWGKAGTDSGYGVIGSSNSGTGVSGTVVSAGGVAIFGNAPTGTNPPSYAGLFQGDVQITSKLTAAEKDFMIDHPLDPENKYLYHASVESPERKNIYDGIITTNAAGTAVIPLPDYFQALNEDFRYQLTPIGNFAQAIISKEIDNNKFEIKTDKPNIRISWQVTGIRKDAYAKANKMIVEEEKLPKDKGKYLCPAAFGQPQKMGITHKSTEEFPKTQSSK